MSKRRIRVVAAQIVQDGRYLITQRKPSSSLPLLWEFPGGKVEDGESDESALTRELFEEMHIEAVVETQVLAMTHEYDAYIIDFQVYRCHLEDPYADIKCIGIHDFRWVQPDELDLYEFPGADQATVDSLLADSDG
jgi:8-oxo-dGTP diphosphatase